MNSRCLVLVFSVFVLGFSATAQTRASQSIKKGHATQTPSTSPLEAQVDSYLKQTGYQYGKVKANSWYISLSGKQMSRIRVIMGAGPNSLAIGAVVVSKKDLPITADSLYKMMKLSYELNYVRTCIDSDDDLIVMSQLKGKWVEYQEFKETIDKVAAAADRAYGEMRPFLAP
jgi:hypothetical protein